ncbi:hypothetical protein GCK72_021111 [Caenorhabditis remanei]|uniref:F-box domain-containing protein n=1 Tax=Caenorhabditis remanei TaxID=31234 RepID=A0A6A5GH83_CAERE|nr:hypothetical protein GCK72_021111 [Caenorhabditis remanei]KAF1754548.1 hypothetical protein GCK72_021111 [Caenorhabditis remanei]
MTTPFPLLRLPRLALIPVLQHMELIEVIAFSLISKRAFNLSKYFYKVSPGSIELLVGSYAIEMRIDDLTMFFYENVPDWVEILHHDKLMRWINAGLSTKQWIQRILAVTKCPSLDKVILNEKPKYDVLSVLDGVSKIFNLHIKPKCCNALAKRAVEVLSPVTSSITLFRVPLSNQEEFLRFWLGNVECLCIRYDDLSRFQFNLNDLLASNAVKLELRKVPMSLRDLNRFFSCWLHRTSNHRLEHLSVQSLKNINEDVLLKGLNATRFTEQQAIHFQSIRVVCHPEFTRGFEVRRIDGKLAAITFYTTFGTTYINFDVWS